MKTRLIGLLALSILAGLLWWRSEQQRAGLRAENQRLRQSLASLETEQEQEAAAIPPPAAPPVSAELLQLRSQVALLRKQTNAIENLQRENAHLKTTLAETARISREGNGGRPPRPREPQDPNAPGVYPRESWGFAGFVLPEDTLKTVAWAMSVGDPQSFLAGLSPAERARFEKRWRDKTEEQIAAESRREMEKTKSFQVLERIDVSDDEVHLRVLADDHDDVRKMRMKRFGNEWKLDGVVKDKKPD